MATPVKWVRSFRVAPMALLLAACGADPGEGEGDRAEEEAGDVALDNAAEADVAEVTQELQSFEPYWADNARSSPALYLGSVYAVVPDDTSDCTSIWVISVESGGAVSAPMPSCGPPGAAVSDTSVFVSDRGSDDILGLKDDLSFDLFKVADTQGDTRGRMLLGPSQVYWADGAGIRRAPRAGGAPTTLKSGSTAELLGIDGSTLYYQIAPFGVVELRRMSTSGSGDALLHSGGQGYTGLSFDANHFYWVDNVSSPRRIRRLPRAGGTAPVTVISSPSRKFHHPRSTGSHLYFVEERLHPEDESAVVVRRRNLSNGSTVTSVNFQLVPVALNLTSTHVHLAEHTPIGGLSPDRRSSLSRGAL